MRYHSSATRPASVLGTFLLLAVLAGLPVAGECTATIFTPNLARSGETIGIQAGPGVSPRVVEEAVALWRRCANYAVGFPALVVGPGQVRTVTVEYDTTSASRACGTFRGNRIKLFAFGLDKQGRPTHCGSTALILAHELGHVLGLADARDEVGCRRHIMSDLHYENRHRRRVQDDECQAASQRWLTLSERSLLSEEPIGVAE